jgi:predicted O-linked N-acetylglucosamine transferase (SPINDLY family)
VADTDLMAQADAHRRAGRLDECADACRRLLRKRPGHPEASYLLAEVIVQKGDDVQALPIAELAVRSAPDRPERPRLLGRILLRLGEADRAATWFREALRLDPNSSTARGDLADALHAKGDLPEAIECYRRAVKLDGQAGNAWWGMGCACSTLKDYATAAIALRRTVEIAPQFGEAWHNLGKALFELGDVESALDAFRNATTLLGPNELTLGMVATIIPGSPRSGNQAILDARRAFAERFVPAAPPSTAPHGAGERLRVGYVSSFFQHRNWMKTVWGVINHHDRARVEVHLFSDTGELPDMTGYVPDPGDRIHLIGGQSNPDVARLVRESGVDVLVDLNGYSKVARIALFALRPCPVQVAWFNYYASSGTDFFDAIFADEQVVPIGEEHFCCEPVVRVPACYLAFEVSYPVPDVSPPPCLSRGHVTFGVLAPQYKITPEAVAVWSRILADGRDSRLILRNTLLVTDSGREYVRGLFDRSGVAEGRVELRGPAEHFEFLATYGDIDLALDSFPYNGGTSTMESLWQGVPLLTFQGDRWASRISASMLHAAGLSEFVAPDVERYASLAAELAADPNTPGKLEVLRRTMRERLRQSAVCDLEQQARFFEREFERLLAATASRTRA